MVKSCDRCKWRMCTGASRTCSIECSADQLSELSIMVASYLPRVSLLAYKYAPETEGFRCYFKFAYQQSLQLQDRDNEGHGFICNLDAGYLSCLENPTDACSLAKEAWVHRVLVMCTHEISEWKDTLCSEVFFVIDLVHTYRNDQLHNKSYYTCYTHLNTISINISSLPG